MNKLRYLWLVCFISLTPLGLAEETATPIKRIVTEVLAEPEFRTHQEVPRLRYSSDSWTESNPSRFLKHIGFIATFFEWLLWIAVAIMIGIFSFYSRRWLNKWQPDQGTSPGFSENATWKTHQIEEKTISADRLAETAWQLWQQSKQVEALSLLYRGALAVLNNRDKLVMPISATEGECLHLVKKQTSNELSHYFSQLTATWQKIAYAQRLPTDDVAQQLCEQWNNHFKLDKVINI